MADRQDEGLTLMRKELEDLGLALSHSEVKQLRLTLVKGKTKVSLESGEIPQNSMTPKSKERDVNPFMELRRSTSIKRRS